MKRALLLAMAAGCGSKAPAPAAPPRPPIEPEPARVERPIDPRWCQIRPDGSATCYGKPPDVGQQGDVVDEYGRKATVHVTNVSPIKDDCGNTVAWELVTETASGDVSDSNYAWAVLFDYEATANTRLIYNEGQIQVPINARGAGIESVWTAFDDNSDDIVDLIITYYHCDAAGAVVAKAEDSGYCMVHYTKRGDSADYDERRVDIIQGC